MQESQASTPSTPSESPTATIVVLDDESLSHVVGGAGPGNSWSSLAGPGNTW